MIKFNPILCVFLSSSFACASNFASSSQEEPVNSSIPVIEKNYFLQFQETKSFHGPPAVTEIKPVGLQFLSAEEMKILNLLNEYLDTSNSNQRVAFKRSNNSFRKGHKAKPNLKNLKKSKKDIKEAAMVDSSMNEMLATFNSLKLQTIQKVEKDLKKVEENEEIIISETKEQFLIGSILEDFESETSKENA